MTIKGQMVFASTFEVDKRAEILQSPIAKALEAPSMIGQAGEGVQKMNWNFPIKSPSVIDLQELLEDFAGDLDQLRSYLTRAGSYLMANYENVYQLFNSGNRLASEQTLTKMKHMAISLRSKCLVDSIDQVVDVMKELENQHTLGLLESLRAQIQESNREFLKLHSYMSQQAS